MPKKTKKQFINVRFEVIPELGEELEKIRLSAPPGDRLNRSAFIRKILYEYVEKNRR